MFVVSKHIRILTKTEFNIFQKEKRLKSLAKKKD
jgi:hypothetical protein